VPAQVASKEQNQNNQYDRAYAAARVITPVLTVWPNWKTPHKCYDNDDRENEHKRHVLATPLTVAMHCLSVSIWADSALRGSAISSFRLTSTAWQDCFSAFLLDIHG